MNSQRKNIDMIWIQSKDMKARFDCKHYSVSYMDVKNKIESMKHSKLKKYVVEKRSEPPIHTDMYGNKENEDIPIISVANFSDFEFDTNQCLYIKKEFINVKSMKSFLLETGDVVYGLVGDVGHSFVVPKNMFPAITYRRVAQLKLINIDNYYVSTFINTKYGKIQFDALSTGVNQAQLRLEDSIEILMPIPSSEIQKYIGDKVRRAEEMKEEAKRLKEECEDIIVKELKESFGIDNIYYKEHAGKLSVDKIYDKRKSTFVSTKLINNRIDPKFYHAEHVDAIKQITNIEHYLLKDSIKEYDTGVSQLEYSERGVPVISTGNINNYFIGDIEKYTPSNIPKNKYLHEEDVLITTYGATSIGKVDIYDKTKVATFDYTLFRAKFRGEYPAYFMCLILRTDLVQKQIKYSINSGGGTNFVNNSSLLDIKIPEIKSKIMSDLNKLMKKSINNIRQSQQLIQQAIQDVEDLIEGNLDGSKLNNTATEGR